MMKKTLSILMMAVLALGIASCSNDDERELAYFSLKGATVRPMGADSLSYEANCNITLTVSKGNRLTMTIADLLITANAKSLPVTLKLESSPIVGSMRDISHIHFSGDAIKSNLFVISNLEGDINLPEQTLSVTFLLNGTQQLEFKSKIDMATLWQLISSIIH